jgi:hypothetical protein
MAAKMLKPLLAVLPLLLSLLLPIKLQSAMVTSPEKEPLLQRAWSGSVLCVGTKLSLELTLKMDDAAAERRPRVEEKDMGSPACPSGGGGASWGSGGFRRKPMGIDMMSRLTMNQPTTKHQQHKRV